MTGRVAGAVVLAIALAILAVPAADAQTETVLVTQVRTGSYDTHDRIVIELDGRAPATGRQEGSQLIVQVGARSSSSLALPDAPTRAGGLELRETDSGSEFVFRPGSARVRAFWLYEPDRIVIDFAAPSADPFEPHAGAEAIPLEGRVAAARTSPPRGDRTPAAERPPAAGGNGNGNDTPLCAQECERLAHSGELRSGITPQGCAISVCLEESRNLYKRNRHAEAMAALEYIHGAAQRSAAYQLERGLVLYALERFEEAIAAFDLVLVEHPNSIRGASQRAHSLVRLKRFGEAKAQFEEMLTTPGAKREYRNIKTESYIRGNIGLILLQEGDLVGGKRELDRALAVDGQNEVANTARYMVLPEMENGNLSARGLIDLMAAFEALELAQAVRAQASLRSLMEESPHFAPAYQILARGLLAQSRYAECEGVLRIAETQIPSNVDLKFQRLRCSILRYGIHSRSSRPAIEEARSLADSHPNNQTGQQLLLAIDEL